MNDIKNSDYSIALKKKLVSMLRIVADVLDKNNIEWWIGYGTAIGAVRHGGFIPWDDDIDIHVRYTDLDKLFSIKHEFENKGITIYSLDNSGFYLTYPNFILIDSSVWEVETQLFVTGISIDIFPLYETDIDLEGYLDIKKKYSKKVKRIQLSSERYSLIYWFKMIKGFHLMRLWTMVTNVLYFRWRRNALVSDFHKFEDKINTSGNKLMFPYTLMHTNNYFQKEWFDGYELFDFEGINVRMPKGYHQYLTSVYGDYMKLPPVEKQVTHHHQIYVNLNKKLAFSEIKKYTNKENY